MFVQLQNLKQICPWQRMEQETQVQSLVGNIRRRELKFSKIFYKFMLETYVWTSKQLVFVKVLPQIKLVIITGRPGQI